MRKRLRKKSNRRPHFRTGGQKSKRWRHRVPIAELLEVRAAPGSALTTVLGLIGLPFSATEQNASQDVTDRLRSYSEAKHATASSSPPSQNSMNSQRKETNEAKQTSDDGRADDVEPPQSRRVSDHRPSASAHEQPRTSRNIAGGLDVQDLSLVDGSLLFDDLQSLLRPNSDDQKQIGMGESGFGGGNLSPGTGEIGSGQSSGAQIGDIARGGRAERTAGRNRDPFDTGGGWPGSRRNSSLVPPNEPVTAAQSPAVSVEGDDSTVAAPELSPQPDPAMSTDAAVANVVTTKIVNLGFETGLDGWTYGEIGGSPTGHGT